VARTPVFQEPRLVASKKVWRNVVIGLPKERATREAAVDSLAVVGLDHHADAWPGTLSGGERSGSRWRGRSCASRSCCSWTEPFAALDALTRLKMQALVAELVATYRPACCS